MFESETVIPLEDFLEKRKNTDAMIYFCNAFLSCVVGKKLWNSSVSTMPMSRIASPSDEAFGYLIVENLYDAWKLQKEKENNPDYAERKTGGGLGEDGRRQPILGKYTKSKYKRAGKFGGWSREGLERFNELYLEVQEDRKDNGDLFEREFGKRNQKPVEVAKRRRGDEGLEPVKIADDLAGW